MRIDSNKEFSDGFRNDFTMDEFVKWYEKRNRFSKIQNYVSLLFGILIIEALLLAVGFAKTNAGISKVFATIAIITFVLFAISVFSADCDSYCSPEDAIIQLHNISLSRYKSSLYNDELESEYKRLPDDILNRYLKAYVTFKENKIDIPQYSNAKLDTEVDRISEYNEELNRKYIKEQEAKNAEIISEVNSCINNDNDTETEDTTDYSNRIINKQAL